MAKVATQPLSEIEPGRERRRKAVQPLPDAARSVPIRCYSCGKEAPAGASADPVALHAAGWRVHELKADARAQLSWWVHACPGCARKGDW